MQPVFSGSGQGTNLAVVIMGHHVALIVWTSGQLTPSCRGYHRVHPPKSIVDIVCLRILLHGPNVEKLREDIVDVSENAIIMTVRNRSSISPKLQDPTLAMPRNGSAQTLTQS